MPGEGPHYPGDPTAIGSLVPRQYASSADIDATESAAAASWRGSLTPEQDAARNLYKGERGPYMNAVLRGEIELPALLKSARALHYGLMQAVMHETLRAYRVVSNRTLTRLDRLRPGETFLAEGFTSLTLDDATAGRLLGEKEDGDVIEVIIPRGYIGAAYIDGPPRTDKHEFEVLIASGANFRYAGRRDNRIVLEAI